MPDQKTEPETRAASTSAGQEPQSDSSLLSASPKVSANIGEGVPSAPSASVSEAPSAETFLTPKPPPEEEALQEAPSQPSSAEGGPAKTAKAEILPENTPREAPAQNAPTGEKPTETVDDQTPPEGAPQEAPTQGTPTDGKPAETVEDEMPLKDPSADILSQGETHEPEPESSTESAPLSASQEGSEQIAAVKLAQESSVENELNTAETQSEDASSKPEPPLATPKSPAEPSPSAGDASPEASEQASPAEGETLGTIEQEGQLAEVPAPIAPGEPKAVEEPDLEEKPTAEAPSEPAKGDTPASPPPSTRSEGTDGAVEQTEGQTSEPNPAKPKRGRSAKRAVLASQAPKEETPVSKPTEDQTRSSQSEDTTEKASRQEPITIDEDRRYQQTVAEYTLPRQSPNIYPPSREAPPPNRDASTSSDRRDPGLVSTEGTSDNPPAGFPWVPIAVVLAIALLLLLILVLLRDWPPPWLPIWGAPDKSSVNPMTPDFYTDDLYGFTIRYPKPGGLVLTAYDTDPDCKGVVFADEMGFRQPSASVYPRFKVCFVAFDAARPAGDIGGQLEARCDQVERNALSLPVRGLMRSTEIGQKRLSAREVYTRAARSRDR